MPDPWVPDPDGEVEDGPYGRWLREIRKMLGDHRFRRLGDMDCEVADAFLRLHGLVSYPLSSHAIREARRRDAGLPPGVTFAMRPERDSPQYERKPRKLHMDGRKWIDDLA